MNRIEFFNTLRFKLVLMAVILIGIPIAAISISYSRTVKEIIKDKYTDTAVESVYEAGEKLNFILNDIEEFSTVIISNRNLLDMLKNASYYSKDEFNNELRSFITSRDDIEVIELVLDEVRYSIGAKKIHEVEPIEDNLKDSSGQPVWLNTKNETIEILSGRFDKQYFTLARKIIDFNTLKNYGYLMIDLEEVLLSQAYKNLLDDSGAQVFICDRYGTIISHSDKSKIGQSITSEPYAAKVLADGNGHDYVQYKASVDKVAIYSTIESNGWKLIRTISTNYLYQEINKIQRYLITGGMVYGILIILYILFFSFRYTEPIIKMRHVMNKAEQGDLNVRTKVTSSDEIGQLGNSLNNMIAEMQVLIDKLVKKEQEKMEVELEALHAQINPHFLYNTLNTIKWMAKIQGNKSVSTAITALIKLLRISINLGTDMITLDKEIEYVQNYIIIQKLRFNESINVGYDVDESCFDILVPKLILQPIVENSIIYGIEYGKSDLNIQIRVFRENSNLIIEIADDGPGIENEVLANILKSTSDKNKFSKVGLNNVNQRIKLYCGDEYGLGIETELGKGTKVTVKLAVNEA